MTFGNWIGIVFFALALFFLIIAIRGVIPPPRSKVGIAIDGFFWAVWRLFQIVLLLNCVAVIVVIMFKRLNFEPVWVSLLLVPAIILLIEGIYVGIRRIKLIRLPLYDRPPPTPEDILRGERWGHLLGFVFFLAFSVLAIGVLIYNLPDLTYWRAAYWWIIVCEAIVFPIMAVVSLLSVFKKGQRFLSAVGHFLKGLFSVALFLIWVGVIGFVIYKWVDALQAIDIDGPITLRTLGVAAWGFGILAAIIGTWRFVGEALEDWSIERKLRRDERRAERDGDRDDFDNWTADQ